MQNYKNLNVWVKSHEITLKIYGLTKGFPKEEIYSLTSQIKRCSSSIPANIAEGCGKNSNKDLGRFLNIALGSANETEYFLLEDHQLLEKTINEIKAMLISLIQKVRL